MSYIITINNCSSDGQYDYLKVPCELSEDDSVNEINSGYIELSLKIPEEIENIINIDNKTFEMEIENKNIITPNSFFADDSSPFPLLKDMND